jgi:hypothetical protein
MVTGMLVPIWPAAGVILLRVGEDAGELTVNVSALLMPATVVTVILLGPEAAADEMFNVAVSCVEPATTFEAVIPAPETLSVAPLRPVPVSFTATLFPAGPLAGVMLLRIGAAGGAVTMNT